MVKIPAGNWHMALAEAIESALDGETIEVRTKSQAELGELARLRMCPDKRLTFEFAVDDLAEETP